jgi:predicted amidohydrolase
MLNNRLTHYQNLLNSTREHYKSLVGVI